MSLTFTEVVVWLIVGGLTGWLVGLIVTRKKEGFGRYANLAIGLVGAMIGGLIFDLFDISLGLDAIRITAEDLLAAFLGAMLLLGGIWFARRKWGAKVPGPPTGPDTPGS
ncbi:MAG: GlsB/YeaQ/YmgE family stress response membrane protein [Planctomycetota bacterium]